MIIGLTGGIATGKSTISNLFKEKGIPVIDNDKIAHDLIKRGQPAYNEIITIFGCDILNEDGEINRKKLGEIVFNNEEKRLILNKIVHPLVKDVVKQEIRKYQQAGYNTIVIDVPLLFESGFDDLCDMTLVVYAHPLVQLERLVKRDRLSNEEAEKRIKAQMSLEEKVLRADYIINNSDTIDETIKQFNQLLEKIKENC
ncbi:MAG: dephospho-CoA kinase [Bacilli bacterium]|nr:dephospho-CoA kinase [Bacilli bacterium]